MSTSTSTPTSILVTPYGASKIVNEVLRNHNLPSIPPQMVYNYTTSRIRQGKNPFIPTTMKDGQVLIKVEDLHTWIEKYVAKKTKK